MPEHLNLNDLQALRDTPPPPSWSALDAEYYAPDEREVLLLREEPTLADRTARLLWGLGGFLLGLVTAVALYGIGGGR